MSVVIGILATVALFALAAFLKPDRDCDGTCSGCPLGTCARAPHDDGEQR